MKRFINVTTKFLLFSFLAFAQLGSRAENGYELWLRYAKIENNAVLAEYQKQFSIVGLNVENSTAEALKQELKTAFGTMLGIDPKFSEVSSNETTVLFALKPQALELGVAQLADFDSLGNEGFVIKNFKKGKQNKVVVTANTSLGLLYGGFRLLMRMQQNVAVSQLNEVSVPKINLRLLNHWDNLDRTVERGYAGFSIWDWHKLPYYIDQRYTDYARANASIGINGVVLNNVNANALILTPHYLEKVAALANVFRPYGIKVYLTARFSAPIEIGKLPTADPLDTAVQAWWNQKADQIYSLIPDFGGFLVKANSEGQPGPQNYGRNHADGANMLAKALVPHNGVVMWRAFVYETDPKTDRAKQAYHEFVPLDGQFLSNVIIQVKNGAIDFQPREPFHPMFGAMPKSQLAMEFQITQEYTGCATHLFYQAPLYKEVFDADTYAKGKGSTVAKITDGSIYKQPITAMAGVANIGTDFNWCGHPFAQANWYAFGRLAWNHDLSAETIAREWLSATFTTDTAFVNKAEPMMMESRENLVDYMTPLGLHHIMAWNHHYGPGPWVNIGRADWTSPYYHKADSVGIGFNRTATGSNALEQYNPEVRAQFENPDSIDLKYLLWFHHVAWDQTLSTGRILWDELCYRYMRGAEKACAQQQTWAALKPYVDAQRFKQVQMLMAMQCREADWWRDACLLYFQQFSKRPFPQGFVTPPLTLDQYMNQQNRFVPGIKNE